VQLICGGEAEVTPHLIRGLASEDKVRQLAPGADLARALRGVSVVHHVGGPELDPDSGRPRAVPGTGLRSLVEAMLQSRVRRLVYLSSACVYGALVPHGPGARLDELTEPQPRHPLERAYWAEERWLKAQRELQVVILRGAQPAAAGDRLLAELKARLKLGGLRLPSGGRAPRTFIAASDLGRALGAAARRGQPGSVLLAGGFVASWREMAQALDPKARIGSVPYELAHLAAGLGLGRQGRGWWRQEALDHLARPQVLDDARSRRDLVWSPLVTSLAECSDELSLTGSKTRPVRSPRGR